MNKAILTTLLFLFLCHVLEAQEGMREMLDLTFSQEIEQDFNTKKRNKWNASYAYSDIGEYAKSTQLFEQELDFGMDSMSTVDSIQFLKYKPVPAFEYLAEKTKVEEIVIISEAHQRPQHRIFTRKLLKSLYENGFRYLGIEALAPNVFDKSKFMLDTQINERAYPLYAKMTGTYTREPQMGNMIREAISLGFEVFAYDRMGNNGNPEREPQQADNIKRFLDARPKGKLLIHCGWSHALESEEENEKIWMANYLKKATGINPLTIYLDALTEKTAIKESPYYKLVDADEFSVLLDKDGNTFKSGDGIEHFDMMIYNPKTKYISNRPDWLFTIEGNVLVEVDKEKLSELSYPIILKANLAIEPELAVPVDIIELDSVEDSTQLVLKKGLKYMVYAIDINRDVVEYVLDVE